LYLNTSFYQAYCRIAVPISSLGCADCHSAQAGSLRYSTNVAFRSSIRQQQTCLRTTLEIIQWVSSFEWERMKTSSWQVRDPAHLGGGQCASGAAPCGEPLANRHPKKEKGAEPPLIDKKPLGEPEAHRKVRRRRRTCFLPSASCLLPSASCLSRSKPLPILQRTQKCLNHLSFKEVSVEGIQFLQPEVVARVI
jgi:hypothetical protein